MMQFVEMSVLEYCRVFKGGAHLSARESAAIGIAYGKACKRGWMHSAVGDTRLTAAQVERMRQFQNMSRGQAKSAGRKLRQDIRCDKDMATAPATLPAPIARIERAPADPNGDSFLQSFEWRRVRMRVLKRDGAKCRCCGATPATGAVMNVDHIKPRRIFPELALDENNLQVLCDECNHGKGNWDMTDWRQKAAT